ncbi:MAG: translocation/assembly module TamB domain-containing protein [Candidatus Zhuqueibacterota bacterium]
MKSRRWILVLALFIATTALIVYYGWNLFEANARIKSYLLAKIKPVLGEDCNIRELEMALGAVHLKGVEVHFKDDYFTLWVQDLRVGLNLFNLIQNGFRPQKIPHDIIFVNPRLTIKPKYQQSSNDSTADSESFAISPDKYLEKVKNLDFIKRMTISKGEINLVDSLSRTVQLAHDINGWFSSRNIGFIYTRLVGKLFHSDDYNLMITGNIDVGLGRIDSLNIKLKNFQWRERIPVFIPSYFEIEQGIIDGALTLYEKGPGKSGFDVTGAIEVRQATFEVLSKKLLFEDVNLKAKIEDWDCLVDTSRFLLNGSPVTVAGRIKNILNPRLDFNVRARQFDIRKTLANFAPKLKFQGLADLEFDIANTYANPTITGHLASQRLLVEGKQISRLSTAIAFSDSVLALSRFSCWIDSVSFGGNGSIDFTRSDNNIRLALTSHGPMFRQLLPLPGSVLSSSASEVQLQCAGDWKQIAGNLTLHVQSDDAPDTNYAFNVNFALAEKVLSLNVDSKTHLFKAQGRINYADGLPVYNVKLTDIHDVLFGISPLDRAKIIFDLKSSTFKIAGKASDLHIDGDVVWNQEKEDLKRSAVMSCDITSRRSRSQLEMVWDISSGGARFTSTMKLEKTPDYLEIKNFEIDRILFCTGKMQLTADQLIEANIIIPDASLPDLNRLIFSHERSAQNGKLYGSIGIGGSLKKLELSGKLDFLDVIINQIGTYEGSVAFQSTDRTVKLNELAVKYQGDLVLTSQGAYQFDRDSLDLKLHGVGIDLNSLMTTLFNKPNVLKGLGDADMQVRGRLRQPEFAGTVEVQKGALGMFTFDRMVWELGESSGSLPSNWTGAAPQTLNGLLLRRVSIVRTGQFQMTGSGVIPFSNEATMDIRLNGQGNILSILPEITPFFLETGSNGTWAFHFTGSPGNLTVADAQLNLTNGYLRLGDVAPEIDDIQVAIELEQDGFLNVKFISGKIKKRPFAFRNMQAAPEVVDINLQPFTIPELGLNLGIFTLETSSKGVPLYIPGFMERGEIGHFEFSGKNAQERFYLAGPTEQPVVRGKIVLQNVNFTYPFITENAEAADSSLVVRVLQMIDWNVRAEVGKDLHYQRQIPSGVDNVYVDLIVDAGVGGLDFNGVLDDKTFGVIGEMESSRGTVEYLDLDFQVTKAGVEFDMDVSRASDVEFDKSTLLPIIYGEARTTVTDSTGFPYYIYLTMLTVDKITGHKLKRGRLSDVVFELSSENQELGDSEGEILASLGYSVTNIREKATDIIGISTDNLVFRPLFRPFERQLERTFGLDMVRFSSRFTRNLIEMNVKDERNFQFDSKLFLLRSTKLMVGKYLADGLFLLYTGQLEAGLDYRYQQEGFGLRHTLGLEYRINSSLLLQMEYDYNSLLLWQREDKKILLRHSFPF